MRPRAIHAGGKAVFGALALVTVTGCLDDDITGTRPVTFTISADVTAPTTGQTVTFTFDATGTGLSEITIDFRDGTVDTRQYSGPLEVTDQAVHSFATAGAYVVVGEVTASEGLATDSITVTVS